MPRSGRAYLRALLGFAITVFVTALVHSLHRALDPSRSTHEFPEPSQAFIFGLIALGGIVNLYGSIGFAVALTPVLWDRLTLRLPLLAGAAGALATMALLEFGGPRLLGLPGPPGVVAAGFLAGLCISLLVLVLAALRRFRAAGA
jgi:hypothetical protein